MTINPYLNFDGNCAEAFKFYEKVLGGQIVMMITNGETPIEMPGAPPDAIMHARLIIGSAVLMGSDVPSGSYKGSHGMNVSLMAESNEEADRIFAALADGGKVYMPIDKTFWAERFGMVSDKYGIDWMINGKQLV